MTNPQSVNQLIHNVAAGQSYTVVNHALWGALGLAEAVMLHYLISWEKYYFDKGTLAEDRFFYRTGEAMDRDLRFPTRTRREVLKRLVKAGVVKSAHRGMPKRQYFRLECDRILEILGCGKLEKPNDNQFGSDCRKGSVTLYPIPAEPAATLRQILPEPLSNKDISSKVNIYASPPSEPSETVEAQQNQFEGIKPPSEAEFGGETNIVSTDDAKIDSSPNSDSLEDQRLAKLWLDKQAQPRMPWGKFNLTRFSKAIRDLRNRVNLTHEQIERVIEFLAKRPVDDFLGKNCVSPTGMLKTWKNGMRPIDAVLMALPEYKREMQRQRYEAAVLSPEEEALIDELFGIEPKTGDHT